MISKFYPYRSKAFLTIFGAAFRFKTRHANKGKSAMGALKTLAMLNVFLVGSAVLSLPARAERYFSNPTLSNRPVSACVTSYRYPVPNHCTDKAKDLIAKKFCKIKGYDTDTYWQSRDVGWDNRVYGSMWTEKFDDGELVQGFYGQADVSTLMTLITCK
jgi:hypothetical protein